jgi:hypothetical protein
VFAPSKKKKKNKINIYIFIYSLSYFSLSIFIIFAAFRLPSTSNAKMQQEVVIGILLC